MAGTTTSTPSTGAATVTGAVDAAKTAVVASGVHAENRLISWIKQPKHLLMVAGGIAVLILALVIAVIG